MRPAAALLAALVVVGGCGPPPEEPHPGHTPPRVVTLAPHLTELVFAAGAGDRLAGVSEYSDYPAAAAGLPRIGDAFRVDMERLLRISPDLVLAWSEGTPAALVDQLRARGFHVREISTRHLEDVAQSLREIGRLLGTEEAAEAAARAFLEALDESAGDAPRGRPLRVFYQVSARPLYTISGSHYISEILERCGARNIFAELGELAPVVTVESVLERDPELILAAAADPSALDGWNRWESITAVRNGALRLLPPDTLARPSPRLAAGVADICRAVRESRSASD